jgi:hypothetical protein
MCEDACHKRPTQKGESKNEQMQVKEAAERSAGIRGESSGRERVGEKGAATRAGNGYGCFHLTRLVKMATNTNWATNYSRSTG